MSLWSAHIRSVLHKFLRAQAGSIATVTALVLPVLIFVVGFAIDIGRTQSVHSALNDAADAAVLAAVSSSAANSVSGGYANTTALKTIGNNVFQANMVNIIGANNLTYTLTVTPNNTGVNASLSYTAKVPTFFSGVLGVPTITATGAATSTAVPPSYMDFYFLLDISQSMGLGATQADITKLEGLTGGCEFGCHVSLNSGPSNYSIARTGGVTMRIDSLKSAVLQTLSDAQTSNAVPNQYRVGLYTMNEGGGMGTLQSLTTNLTAATTSANTIDLGPTETAGYGQSYYGTTLAAMNTLIPTPGDGSAATKPLKFVFLISDGVDDEYNAAATWGHQTSTLDPALCQTLKARGITVAVIYTTYLPMPAENQYQVLVAPFASQIAPAMQSCASPGYYYQASDGPGISAGLTALFSKAKGNGHLSS